MLRRLVALSSIALAATLSSCASDDPKVERRGGELPPDDSEAWCTRGLGEPVPFCDVMTILRAKCQMCHQDPPLYAAPVAFMTYEDTQQEYYDHERHFPEIMIKAVETDFMPFLGLNGMEGGPPEPAQPLTPEEKTTLLTWLKQCAPPTGGTDCPIE